MTAKEKYSSIAHGCPASHFESNNGHVAVAISFAFDQKISFSCFTKLMSALRHNFVDIRCGDHPDEQRIINSDELLSLLIAEADRVQLAERRNTCRPS